MGVQASHYCLYHTVLPSFQASFGARTWTSLIMQITSESIPHADQQNVKSLLFKILILCALPPLLGLPAVWAAFRSNDRRKYACSDDMGCCLDLFGNCWIFLPLFTHSITTKIRLAQLRTSSPALFRAYAWSRWMTTGHHNQACAPAGYSWRRSSSVVADGGD